MMQYLLGCMHGSVLLWRRFVDQINNKFFNYLLDFSCTLHKTKPIPTLFFSLSLFLSTSFCMIHTNKGQSLCMYDYLPSANHRGMKKSLSENGEKRKLLLLLMSTRLPANFVPFAISLHGRLKEGRGWVWLSSFLIIWHGWCLAVHQTFPMRSYLDNSLLLLLKKE